MRTFLVLFSLVFLALLAPSSAQTVTNFEELEPGLEYREFTLTSPRNIKIYQLRCDPKKVRFNILLATDLKKTLRATTVKPIAESFKQLAVINSSYFGHQDEILGYASRYQEILNSEVAQAGIFSAFFYWDGGRAGLKRRGESLPKNVPVLFQCGPRLVWDREVVAGLEKNRKAARSGVAIDSQGRVVLFAYVGDGTTLAELPGFLLESVKRGGVDPVRAMNFDGGSSTQFYLKAGGKKVHVPNIAKVPVFLGVSTR